MRIVFDGQLNRFRVLAPAISPASHNARSIPADTPADVTTFPARTTRSFGIGVAPMILSTPSCTSASWP